MENGLSELKEKFKVVMVGDSSVGKTSLFLRFDNKPFTRNATPTVGAACINAKVEMSETTVHLMVWDTAGQDSFRHIIPMYFNRAAFILVVFDLTSIDSLKSVEDWVILAKNRTPEDSVLILIGNKSDLVDERKIARDDVRSLVQSLRIANYFETSALSGDGIDSVLLEIGIRALALRNNEKQGIDLQRQPKNRDCCT